MRGELSCGQNWAEEAEAPAGAAALTLGQVMDVSPASEQVPAGEQGIQRGGEAGGSPNHDISQEVDLSLQATGRGCQRCLRGGAPSPMLRQMGHSRKCRFVYPRRSRDSV